MDFWSRLVRGGTPQKKVPTSPNSPQLRLAHFKRAYNNLLQIWHNGDGVSDDVFVAENVRICLHRLAELLNDDQRGPNPHLCVSFAATSRLLVTISKISAAFQNDAITHEALETCSLLIDSEEEAFLEDKGFADTLPDFIESIQRSLQRLGDPETESSMVELLFGIASKLRLEPHILRVWFRPEKPEEDDEELSESERRTRLEEFPLFYLLLRYVPAEGRAGEFARMGLLYIIESVAHSQDLEKWIVEGDMSALMASGLGALYSQLSRKLALSYTQEETPPILTFSDRLRAETLFDAEETTSPEYQSHLATFLASLVFWQDLLEHCTSDEVKQTLLDHFQYLFLQQLLYPSLLESSDIDGGSSVAVLTYLRHILESIDHPDLVRLTLQYLFGLQEAQEDVDALRTPIKLARRRKSQKLIARVITEDNQLSPDLFNLSDLIMASLRSRSQQTITATLLILSAMLRRTHHRGLTTLLRTRSAQPSERLRSVGGQEKEVDQLLSLAENITAFQDLETLYEQYLYDNRNMLESHPCSIQFLSLPVSNAKVLPRETSKEASSYRILTLEDPTFESLISLLDRFFENDIETNLGLTQVIVDLASCPYMRLEGWLLTSPSAYIFPPSPSLPTESTPSKSQLLDIMLSRRHPNHPLPSSSPILQTLTRLAQTINNTFRRTIPSFDSHILSCRAAISPQPLSPTSSLPPSRSPSRSTQPPHQATPQATPIPSRLRASDSSSRNSTPSRGRQLETPSQDRSSTPSTLVARLGHLQAKSLSRSPTKGTPQHSKALGPDPSRSPYRSDTRSGITTPQKPLLRPPMIPLALQRRIRVSSGTSGTFSDRNDTGRSRRPIEADAESDSEIGRLGSDDEGEADDDGAEDEDDEEEGRIGRARARKGAASSERGVSGVSEEQGEDGDEMESAGGKNGSREIEGRKKVGRNTEAEMSGSRGGREGEEDGIANRNANANAKGDGDGSVTLGHLCTNVIVLQEFILELAAVVEVRAGLFGEVDYFQV